ncbi:hypothetical protein mRhiFer1_010032 [Rhinolophus ferrumequinum]|uniref:HTH CENPB-type domain-containing protein n=1 Tax=Rhinolophus ferrumequinum TaxID=59479 RepID=A0A7J7Y5B4_RHIFE|nr:hypothetical protein mRhiFer1_010032 [Rhinolophus ferrumequinum]
MSNSTTSRILKNKNKVKKAIIRPASMKATKVTKIREGPISDREKILTTGFKDQAQKCIPLSTMMIIAKEKSLFTLLKEKAGPKYNVEFTSSFGWFKRFNNSYPFYNVKGSHSCRSADVKAAEELLETLDKLIVDDNYLPEQMFNMNKSSLFWNWMPKRTFIHSETKSRTGFKAFKDTKTILFGNNVADYKSKSFVIWHRFAEDEEVAQINKAMVEMANNLNLGVDENDIEELLEVVPEELTNELVEREQECTANKEEREKEPAGEEKEELPRKLTVKG